MSYALDPLDLSTAATGKTYTLDWTNKIKQGAPYGLGRGRPTLRMFNESGVGLKYQLGIRSDRVPAGGWVDVQINGENSATMLVEYTLPGQPVSLLLGTIYEVGESIPPIPTLGNSPIGVGGQVATSGTGGTDHILNSGNPPATATYTTTPSDQSGASIGDTNDGAGFRKILSANVLRTVWNIVRGNATTGKASVQLGDSGDPSITTLYGVVGAGSQVPAGTVTGTLPAGQVGAGYPAASVASPPWLPETGGAMTGRIDLTPTSGDASRVVSTDGTRQQVLGVGGSSYSGGVGFYLYDLTSNAFVFQQATPTGISFNGHVSAGGSGFLPPAGGSLAGLSPISGSGSATVNHGLSITPNTAVVNTNNGSNSTTFGSGSYGPTTLFIYQFNPQPWVGLVYKS